MVEGKKSACFLIIAFVLLSNISLAQSFDESPRENSDGRFAGRPNFDASFEGRQEFQGQDNFNPMEGIDMRPGSENQEPSEEKLREMAKAKMGSGFSEEEFRRMMENRRPNFGSREDFSYEQEGFEHRYDAGPSYEGFSKEQMLFSAVFENIGDDIDPRGIKEQCSEPDKIADSVIERLKSKLGDISKLCDNIKSKEANCNDNTKKMCATIGTPSVRGDANEFEKIQSIATACPVNKDAVIQSCISRSRAHLEGQMKNAQASCQDRISSNEQRMKQECERLNDNQLCDKEKFISQCLSNMGARRDDFDEGGKRRAVCPKYPAPNCSDGKLEIHQDAAGCEAYRCVSSGACPTPIAPACRDSESVQKRVDEKGCVFYYCQVSAAQCPEAAQPVCDSNSHAERKVDDKGCVSYYCTSNPCPAPSTPSCPPNSKIESKADSKGCVSYYCGTPACPEVPRPTCASGETLETYYDNAKCISGYQCVKPKPICPEPSRPACQEGQTMTTKYDSNNCPSYECVTVAASSVTGAVVLDNYDDYLRKCESSWGQQEKACVGMKSSCSQDNFVDKCTEMTQKNNEGLLARIEESCSSQVESFIRAAEDKCSRIDKEKQRCLEQTEKRCSQMDGLSSKCRETLTEDNIKRFIVQEAQKRCKFKDKLEDQEGIRKSDKAEIVLAVVNTATKGDFDKLNLFVDDLREDLKLESTTVYKGTINPNNFGDIKLLPFVVNAKISTSVSSERSKDVKEKLVASQKVEEAASKLVSLRDSDVPKEYLYIIEDKASDVLNVSDSLGEIEKKEDEKGAGYRMRRFFGLAKQAEEQEIRQLGESKSKLQNSIDTLAKLIDEVPSDVAKSILKEQVENLKKQQDDIQSLIDSKEKKAKGFFGIFG